MSRTNIEIDDELIGRVMERNGIATKRAAVEWALRKADLEPMTPDEIMAMAGTNFWTGDPAAIDLDPEEFADLYAEHAKNSA